MRVRLGLDGVLDVEISALGSGRSSSLHDSPISAGSVRAVSNGGCSELFDSSLNDGPSVRGISILDGIGR